MATKTRLKPRWDRIIILLIVVAIILGAGVQAALGSDQPREVVEIDVESGDTLWSLVKEYNPDFRGNMSEACYIVKEMNGMSQSMIYAGQTLVMPIDFK